jgi:hypothetical protein
MVSLVQANPSIVEVANGMLSHLNTSLQDTYVVSRKKYNDLVQHYFGHTSTPQITMQVRQYLSSKNYLMQPQGRGFVLAYMKPNQTELVPMEEPKRAAKCDWASHMIRLRDSFVEDFEHNRHPEYTITQAAFETRVLAFYKTADFDGRFRNMFRDLMRTVALKVSFLAGNVTFGKFSVVIVKKKGHVSAPQPVVPKVQTKIPKKEWAGIIKQAVVRIGDRMKHSATFTVVCTHEQFRELITFWPSEPEFIDQLNKALAKQAQKVVVAKTVVRVAFDHIAERDSHVPIIRPRRPKGSVPIIRAPRAPKVEKPIAKVFNAQALFAVIDKSFREAMGDISQLRWADDYTHAVTLMEYDTDKTDGQLVHFVDEDVRIAGRNVDELYLRRGDIVLTNDAGAKMFRKAVRHVNEAPCRMCKVTKLKF